MITYLQNWKNAHQLEILIFCLAFVLVLTYVFKQKMTKRQFYKYVLLCSGLYLCAVFYMTVFGRYESEKLIYNFELFWSYKLALKDMGYLEQIGLNVLLFVPLGILWTSLLDNTQWLYYGVVLICGGIISTSIEALQYLMMRGLSEVDDIISNMMGVGLGAIIWRIAHRIRWHRNVRNDRDMISD